MSGHVPLDAGQEPEEQDGGELPEVTGAVDPDDATGDAEHGDLDVDRLPSVLHGESAWSRMDERAAMLDHWVPPPPYLSHAEANRSRRRVLAGGLAVIVLAAGLGGVAGALLVGGGARGVQPDAGEAVEALRGSIGQLATEVRSLRDGLGQDSQTTAAGLAAIQQRIAGAETAQADLSARIAGLSAPPSAAPGRAVPAVSQEITGSIAPPPLPVAQDWILWRVRNGRALVQGAPGYFEVETGSALPGLGIIQRIVKEEGRWMVYTPYAVIVARD
jgi:hypothetical protein